MYKLTILIATLAMVATGCEYKDFNETKEFEGIITHVDADADSASILVRPTYSDVMTVEADLEYWGEEPDFEARIEGKILIVELDCHPSCDGEIVLLVPQNVSLHGDTGSGNIVVEDIEGGIEVSTGSGNVRVENAQGDLNLETGSGNITGHNLSSLACLADTGSGNVNMTFDEVPSYVNMDTGSGNVKLAVPYGSYDVSCDTGSGNTNIDGLIDDPDSPNTIRAETGSGNVTIQGL